MGLWTSHRSESKVGGPIFVWLLAVALGGTISVAVTGATVGVIARHLVARKTFKSTAGVVQRSWIEENQGNDGFSYRPRVECRYHVDGQTYTGGDFTFDASWYSSDRRAEHFVRSAPVGREVTVYYNPDSPAESVLQLHVDPMNWLTPMALWPFMLGGPLLVLLFARRLIVGDQIAGTATTGSARSDERFDGINSWGQFERIGHALSIQAPLLRWRKIGLLLLGLPMVCGLPVFTCAAVVGGWLISGHAVATAWSVAFGLLGTSIILQIVNRGPRLTLHRDRRRMTLTSWRRNEDIAFEDIETWTLKWMPSPLLWLSVIRLPVMLLSAKLRDGRIVPVQVFAGRADGQEEAAAALAFFAKSTHVPFEPPPVDHQKYMHLITSASARGGGPWKLAGLPNVRGWLVYGDLC